MKFILLVLVFLINVCDMSAQGIEFFEGTWEEALELSKKEGKPIFVDAYATWCGPCMRMARTTFKDAEVGKFMNERFISLKLDMEKGKGIRFGQKFPVSSFPTLFFIDHNEELLLKRVGAQQPDELIALAQFVLDNIDYSADYVERYDEGERDPVFILEYVTSLNRSNKNSQVVANDYFRSKSHQLKSETDFKILFEATQYIDSKLFETLIENMKTVETLYPKDRIEEQVIQAAKNTVQRAIEFQVETIKEESIAAVKKYAPSNYKEFVVVQNLEYYKSTRNREEYKKAAEAFVDYYFNKDNEKVFDLCLECIQIFDRDEDFLVFAEQHLKKLSKKEKEAMYFQALAEVYYYKKDRKNALKYIDMARALAIENGQSTNGMDQLKRRIES